MKVGDKYIIEIEEVIRRNGAPQIARIKGFKYLSLDEYGLEKLEPYENNRREVYLEGYTAGYGDGKSVVEIPEIDKRDIADAYNKGLNDAWNAAKWLYNNPVNITEDIFDCDFYDIYCTNKYTVQEVVHKIKEYENEQKQDTGIKVGDEVTTKFGNKGIVITNEPSMEGCISVWFLTCTHVQLYPIKDLLKTGRHFPQIAEVMTKLRSEG